MQEVRHRHISAQKPTSSGPTKKHHPRPGRNSRASPTPQNQSRDLLHSPPHHGLAIRLHPRQVQQTQPRPHRLIRRRPQIRPRIPTAQGRDGASLHPQRPQCPMRPRPNHNRHNKTRNLHPARLDTPFPNLLSLRHGQIPPPLPNATRRTNPPSVPPGRHIPPPIRHPAHPHSAPLALGRDCFDVAPDIPARPPAGGIESADIPFDNVPRPARLGGRPDVSAEQLLARAARGGVARLLGRGRAGSGCDDAPGRIGRWYRYRCRHYWNTATGDDGKVTASVAGVAVGRGGRLCYRACLATDNRVMWNSAMPGHKPQGLRKQGLRCQKSRGCARQRRPMRHAEHATKGSYEISPNRDRYRGWRWNRPEEKRTRQASNKHGVSDETDSPSVPGPSAIITMTLF